MLRNQYSPFHNKVKVLRRLKNKYNTHLLNNLSNVNQKILLNKKI